jgi:deoxyribodipyrimidine photo-lyase
MEKYYTCLRQPLHSTPERINRLQLSLDIPQFTFSDLKPKYSQFWETDNTYFIGGET